MTQKYFNLNNLRMERLELSREISLEPKSSASTNSATPAQLKIFSLKKTTLSFISIIIYFQYVKY